MTETIKELRAQWADGSLSSAQVDDLLTRLASAESRAVRAVAEIARLRAMVPQPCPAEDCVGGTLIHDNGFRSPCPTCQGVGSLPAPVATKGGE